MSDRTRRIGVYLPILLAVVVSMATPARAEERTRLNSVDVVMHIRGPLCDPNDANVGLITATTPLETPIFNQRGCGPVLDPDGNHLNLGAFRAAQGTIGARCISRGTEAAVHFTGLIPRGVYTVWLFIFGPGGPPNQVAVGALGTSFPDAPAIQNVFTASDSGEGEMSRLTRPGQLSALQGFFDGCFLDEVETHVALVYHIDNQTYGPVPGPTNVWVAQEVFIIK